MIPRSIDIIPLKINKQVLKANDTLALWCIDKCLVRLWGGNSGLEIIGIRSKRG